MLCIVQPITDFSVNRRGARVQLSEIGKHYCGQRVLQCTCCNGICGPNGCNCPDCMMLDIDAWGLPLGHLVNYAGEISRRAPDGLYYCGITMKNRDGFTYVCALDSKLSNTPYHCQCLACSRLSLPYYDAVAGYGNAPPPTQRSVIVQDYQNSPYMAPNQQYAVAYGAAPPPPIAMLQGPFYPQQSGTSPNLASFSQGNTGLLYRPPLMNAFTGARAAQQSYSSRSPSSPLSSPPNFTSPNPRPPLCRPS